MAEQLNCRDVFYNNDYADYIVEYLGGMEGLKNIYNPACIQQINYRFFGFAQQLTGNPMITLNQYGYGTIPKCFGLLDISSMEDAGILRVRRQPYLNLTGRGILIGIIDTGIDYTNPIFQNADNTTRIVSIWDQTERSGVPPIEIYYGSEYTQDMINEALKSEDPYSIVPTKDEIGHGTFLAGLAAGNEDLENQFTGAAPEAELVVVKLKEAKQHLKDYFCIQNGAVAYSELDIMLGLKYLLNVATQKNMPLVVYLGLGTNAGNHSGLLNLCRYFNISSTTPGTAYVVAAGNEGNLGHHYQSSLLSEEAEEEVEFRVGENENGVYMELWTSAPNLFSVGLISPLGEYTGKIPLWYKDGRAISFPLEASQVYIHYTVVENYTGDEVVTIQIVAPSEGIWKLRVFNDGSNSAAYNIWMGMEHFVTEDTYFLSPEPYITVCEPGNASSVLTITAYNHISNGIYPEASRGYTITNDIKPEITAPGVNVYGPLLSGRFGTMSGTSVSGAIAAGAAAMMLEWGVVRGNSRTMQTTEIENLFIRGAKRVNMNYPNREWGYGILDLYGVFESMGIS